MSKKIVCFILALVMVLGLLPTTVVTANAASKLTTSDKAIDVLKEYIEFKENPEQEGTKWYIGYGTEISAADAANKYLNGISKADALVLLKEKVRDEIDDAINAFTAAGTGHNLDLTQYQHDALALFTYNRGTGWMSGGDLYEAVRTGKTGMDFVEVIASKQYLGNVTVADGEAFEAAMNRRLSEANMYLNNSYGYYAPDAYSYVILDLDGDEKIETSDTYMLYNTTTERAIGRVPTAAEAGSNDANRFVGWFEFDGYPDGLVEGMPLTTLDKDTAGMRLVAKYYTGSLDGTIAEINANFKMNASALGNRYVFRRIATRDELSSMSTEGVKHPEAFDFFDGKLARGSECTVEVVARVNGMFWLRVVGKDSDGDRLGGWVYAGEEYELDGEEEEEATIVATATINVPSAKVQSGATDNGNTNVLDYLTEGQVVNIYEMKVEKTETGNKTWGKVDYIKKATGERIIGWLNLAYADVLEYVGETDSAEGRYAKVVNTDFVNVRSSAEITNNIITSLAYGTEVKVLETKMNGNAEWAYVRWEGLRDGYTEGWVYIYYLEIEGLEHTDPENNTAETVLYTGVVNSNINLNVRSSPKVTLTNKVGSLAYGTQVNIYEIETASNGVKWGRIGEDKWICLQYVTLTKVESSSGSASTTTTIQATVNVATLNVHKNYNSNSAIVGTLKKADVVTILEKNTEETETGSRIWGRFVKDGVEGWINLAYVDLKTVTSVSGGSTSTGSGTSNAGGANAVISNCISVNIRKAAGVSNAQITKLNNGTAVQVYDQVTKDSAPWARITWTENGVTKEGWVCMNYVTVAATGTTPNSNGSTVNGTNSNTISATGTVNSNINLKVRSGAGTEYAEMGSLVKGTQVTIYDQVYNNGMIWGRIVYNGQSGYICLSYVTVDNTSITGNGVMGTIARCANAVNVRSAPGTGNALVGTIGVGKRVEVFESREYSNQMWYRVAQGWICGDYLLLDSQLPPGTALDATQPTTEATQATEPEATVNKDNEVSYKITGTVNVASADLRNAADADSIRVGTIKVGQVVDVLALKVNNAELWGRIDQYAGVGWLNMENVTYGVHGYVNTDDQAIYANADTTSTVKGNLSINKELNITKLTVNGETVYGWVEEGLNGWIPMGRVSTDPVEVIPTYKSTLDSHTSGRNIFGVTNTTLTAYNEPNGKEEKFYLKSGVTVYIDDIDLEYGVLWGEVIANGVTGWINLAGVTYTVTGSTTTATNVDPDGFPVRTDKSNSSDSNIFERIGYGTSVTLCELSFDAAGNLWGKVTGMTGDMAKLNGGYIMVRSCDTTYYHIQLLVTGIITM